MTRELKRTRVDATVIRGAFGDRSEAELLGELARSLNASLDLDTILQRIAEVARALCRCDIVRIALREPAGDVLTFRFSVGSRHQAYRDLRLGPGRGLAGHVLATGQPARTPDIQQDPRLVPAYLPFIRAERTRSVLVVPVRIGERIEGLIYAGKRRPRHFGEREESALLRLADHAAAALRNNQLFAAERAAREDAEATQKRLAFLGEASTLLTSSLDYEQTLGSLARLAVPMMADLCVIDVLAEDGTIRRVAAAHANAAKQELAAILQERFAPDPQGQHPVAEALRSRQPVMTADLIHDPRIVISPELRRRVEQAPHRAGLAVRLLVHGDVIGVLFLGDRAGRRFTADEVRVAQAFADQAASAARATRPRRPASLRTSFWPCWPTSCATPWVPSAAAFIWSASGSAPIPSCSAPGPSSSASSRI